MSANWFEEWFNSEYYPILYKNRDEEEAARFINVILNHLDPQPKACMLDLACGKGRYSVQLANKGYGVTGLDIADANIEYAQQFERENLSFFKHDMRLPFRVNYFDYIFNFFTSFGYFETYADHLNTIKNVHIGLKQGGKFVLDFFNTHKVLYNLVPKEEKRENGIVFRIERFVEDGYIIKKIEVDDGGKQQVFREKVRGFTLEELIALFEEAGLHILDVFGNYDLGNYETLHSDRLILIAGK